MNYILRTDTLDEKNSEEYTTKTKSKSSLKLLSAGPQPIALLPVSKPMSDEEMKAWWEKQLASIDLKIELIELFKLME